MALELLFGAEPAADRAHLTSVVHGAAAEPGAVQVHLRPLLDTPMPFYEHWQLSGGAQSGCLGAARYRHDDMLLFVSVDAGADAADIESVTKSAYDALFATMHVLGFEYLVRCWNYVPYINAQQPDAAGEPMERYRLFNRARQAAFERARQSVGPGAPAACALGAHSGPLTLYAIAARRAPLHVENPRQVSAYHYPQQYGPKSPSFSRAVVLPLADEAVLFVSGTASIVGHESRHIGELVAQTEESLRNIEAVTAHANALSGESFTLGGLHYKVFVRHADDAAVVAEVLRHALGPVVRIDYLEADVCRAELLVEIEAVGFVGKSAA